MELPEKVKVAGFDIEIVKWSHKEAAANRRFGEFSCSESLIRIDESLNKFKLVDVLLHEINHAIYWAYHILDSDEEERVVSVFSTAWTQVFRDNPDVVKFIQSNLNE